MKRLLLSLVLIGLAGGAAFVLSRDRGVDVAGLEVWHGGTQRVGHLGDAQPDFNLMGEARCDGLTLAINGGPPRALTVAEGPFGFRRLGAEGHFNADIAIEELRVGANELVLQAAGRTSSATARIQLERVPGDPVALPLELRWGELDSIQDGGQAVDGEWRLDGGALVNVRAAYDRLFLIGNRSWRDYEVRTTVALDEVAGTTGPHSGAPGVGVIMRFAGHSVSPPRFPEAQPKWGYQPFGAILWLRFVGGAEASPVRQHYHGARDASEDGAALGGFAIGASYALRAQCGGVPGAPGATRYRLRVWPEGAPEPEAWDLDVLQEDPAALDAGGFALVAHHVRARFGDVTVTAVE